MSQEHHGAEQANTATEYETLIHTIEGVDGQKRSMSERAAVNATDETEAAHVAVNHYLESLDDAGAMRNGIGPGARMSIDVFKDRRTREGLDTDVWHVDILLDGSNPVVH